MTESHVAVSATGLLADFNRAGALTWADVHPAQQLGHLFGERVQRVQLAQALQRLAQQWLNAPGSGVA